MERKNAEQELINGLNNELTAEYLALIELGTIVAHFRAEVADRQQRVKFLTKAVTELGGQPVDVPPLSLLTCDPRGLTTTIRSHERTPIGPYQQPIPRLNGRDHLASPNALAKHGRR